MYNIVFQFFKDYCKMPIRRGKDSKGSYYQWGNRTKYYYKTGNKKSREEAYKKAWGQTRAIFSSGWRGK